MTNNTPDSASPVAPASELQIALLKQGKQSLKKNRLQDAEAAFAQLISLDEQNAESWYQLGITWIRMGKTSEAKDALTMAHSLVPRPTDMSANILHDLGLLCLETDDVATGLNYLEQSYQIKPDEQLAQTLGDNYHGLHEFQKSAFYYLKAYQENKKDERLQSNLSIALYCNGDFDQSLGILAPLVIKHPNNRKYLANLTDFYRRNPQCVFNENAKKAIEICLKHDDLPVLNFRAAWSGLLLLDPAYDKMRQFARNLGTEKEGEIVLGEIGKALGSSFLCAGLSQSLASGIALEYILSNLRSYFLTHWEEFESWPNDVTKFFTALSVQCWFNDFVFYLGDDERKKLSALGERVRSMLDNPEHKLSDHDAKLLTLYCCYEPLYSFYQSDAKLPFSKGILHMLKPLVLHQLTNPKTEAGLIPSIESFTEIEDVTSKAVQTMYEQRPYPRWINLHAQSDSEERKQKSHGIEILVAGCGTGQEVGFYATALPEAKITAIDLSRTSIAYAMRQAEKFGYLSRVRFLHGDLMQAAKLEQKFDYITSSGVLHHLKDPDKGLEAIRGLLKDGGRMSLSLYSKPARDYLLNPALDYIKEKGYSSSLDDVRQFRRDLFAMKADDPILRCTIAADFFSLAECNDMLFHVQEHRYTLPEFRDFAARHDLEPFHVYLSPEKKQSFHAQFPDKDIMDLDVLSEFEEKNPRTFEEMYKIYFRANGDTSSNPLDSLILFGSI